MILFENLFLIFSELNSDFFNFSKISLHLDLVIREMLCTSHPFLRWGMTVKARLNQKWLILIIKFRTESVKYLSEKNSS